MKFPRTYADLDNAPWCTGYELPDSTGGCHIYIDFRWLPPGDYISPYGETSLKDALKDLKSLWPLIRKPIR